MHTVNHIRGFTGFGSWVISVIQPQRVVSYTDFGTLKKLRYAKLSSSSQSCYNYIIRDRFRQARGNRVRFLYISSPIWKLAKKNLGKKFLNVTTVKLLLKNKIQCFWVFLMSFCFKLYLKVNIHPFHDFLLIIARKWPLKLVIFQNSLRN